MDATISIRAPSVERARLTFFASLAVANLGLLVVAAATRERWISYLTILGALWVVLRAFDGRDQIALRLLAFSGLQGIGLLWWDWLLIRVIGSLHYPPSGPFLALSPVYMPFAWTITLAPIFCVAVSRGAGGRARTNTAVVSGMLFYATSEILAVRAGWWSYTGAPMIAGVPVYVLLTYPGLLLVSTRLASWIQHGPPSRVVTAAAVALAWGVPTTALAWAVAVAPFR